MPSFEMDGSWRLPLGPTPNVSCHESQGEFQKHGLVSHRILEWLEFWVIMTIRNNHYLWKLAWGQARLQGDARRAVNSALRVETHFQMGFLFSRIPPPQKSESCRPDPWQASRVISFATEKMVSLLLLQGSSSQKRRLGCLCPMYHSWPQAESPHLPAEWTWLPVCSILHFVWSFVLVRATPSTLQRFP